MLIFCDDAICTKRAIIITMKRGNVFENIYLKKTSPLNISATTPSIPKYVRRGKSAPYSMTQFIYIFKAFEVYVAIYKCMYALMG